MLLADEIDAAYFQVRFTRTPPVSAYPARFIAGSPHGPCFVRNIVRLVRRRTVGIAGDALSSPKKRAVGAIAARQMQPTPLLFRNSRA